MAFTPIPEHDFDTNCEHLKAGNCYRCCDRCNYDRHTCHFCGEELDHNGNAWEKGEKVRHWLSDCRPDLVEHEPGPTCTWWAMTRPEFLQKLVDDGKAHLAEAYEGHAVCYAYQDPDTGEFGAEHKHFHRDGRTG